MPAQVSPTHRTDALLIGTGEFAICPGVTTAAAAALAGYKEFGNIKVFDLGADGDTKEHYGSYRGTQIRDRIDNRKLKIGYKLTCDEWTPDMVNYLIFGAAASPSNYTRTVITAAAGTAWPFTTTPADLSRWYEVLDASGNKVRAITALTIAGKVEGTDFVVDYALGRVRFLTAQAVNLTPTITAPAVVVGDNNNASIITPLNQGLIQGMCRLTVWDELARQQLVLEHDGFYGQVVLDKSASVKGDDYSDYVLNVNVGTPKGLLYVRAQYNA